MLEQTILLLSWGSCCSALLYYQAKEKASRLNTRQKNWKGSNELFI